jgi:hypothetical protein
VTGELQRPRVHDLDETSTLDTVGRLAVTGGVDDDEVGPADVISKLRALGEEHPGDRGRQGLEVFRARGHDPVDAMMDRLRHEGGGVHTGGPDV